MEAEEIDPIRPVRYILAFYGHSWRLKDLSDHFRSDVSLRTPDNCLTPNSEAAYITGEGELWFVSCLFDREVKLCKVS